MEAGAHGIYYFIVILLLHNKHLLSTYYLLVPVLRKVKELDIQMIDMVRKGRSQDLELSLSDFKISALINHEIKIINNNSNI